MDDLHLVGLTEDGEHLVLSSQHGEQFRLPLDDRLLAAIRGDLVRLGRLQAEPASLLRPAQIQARIRAGESAEQVALAAGIPVAKVRRYEGPVLAEREHIAGLARRTPARRRGDGFVPALGDLVEERLLDLGRAPGDLRWDAGRRDEATWTVTVTAPAGGPDSAVPHAVAAIWAFDPRRGLLTPENEDAQELSGEEPPARHAAERAAPPARRLTSVPSSPEDRADGAGDEPGGLAAGETRPEAPDVEPDVELSGPAMPAGAVDDPGDGSSEDLADTAPEAQPAAAPRPGPARHSARGRRASVPAWDDIVFGTRPKD